MLIMKHPPMQIEHCENQKRRDKAAKVEND